MTALAHINIELFGGRGGSEYGNTDISIRLRTTSGNNGPTKSSRMACDYDDTKSGQHVATMEICIEPSRDYQAKALLRFQITPNTKYLRGAFFSHSPVPQVLLSEQFQNGGDEHF